MDLLLLFVLNAKVVPPLEVEATAACEGKVVVRLYSGEILMPSVCAMGWGGWWIDRVRQAWCRD